MVRENRLSSFARGLVQTGDQYALTITERHRLYNMNVAYISSFIFSFAYIAAYSIIDLSLFFPVIIILAATLLLYSAGYILIRSGRIEIARHLICFLIPLPIAAITYFYFGKEINLHFYLIAFSFFPPMLWEMKDYKKIFLYQFIYILIFTYFHFFFHNQNSPILFPDGLRSSFNAVSFFASLGSIGSVLFTTIKASERYENELIEARNKAEESNKLKTQFLANMSHEIRTPLNGILGFLTLLKEYELTEEERKKYIDLMSSSGERLLDTINDIILMSKIETRNVELDYSIFNINDVLTYLVTFYRPQAELKGLEFRFKNSVPEGSSVILCDKTKLEGILTNLIRNAIKFTKTGFIELECLMTGRQLEFRVKDTGRGIPINKQSLIFERFVQGEMNISRSYEGSGLGLSITKAYVEMLQGSVKVESEEGKGSVFTVQVPYQAAKKDSLNRKDVSNEKNSRVPAKRYKGIKILVAEDDDPGFLYLRTVLERKGAECIRTIDGMKTVKAVREDDSLSMILMDIKLPLLDGLEATREIRKFNSDIPIIAQTAFALEGDREKALKAGCNDYLAKPIKQVDLFSLIDRHLVIQEIDFAD